MDLMHCKMGGLSRPTADCRLAGGAGGSWQSALHSAAGRCHSTHYHQDEGVAVRQQSDQQIQLPPLVLLCPRHVVPGILALVSVPGRAKEEALSHPGGADHHCGGVEGLSGGAGGQGSMQKYFVQARHRPTSRMVEVLLSTSFKILDRSSMS